MTSDRSCSLLSCNTTCPLRVVGRAAPSASSNAVGDSIPFSQGPREQSWFKHDLLNDTKLKEGTSFQPVRRIASPTPAVVTSLNRRDSPVCCYRVSFLFGWFFSPELTGKDHCLFLNRLSHLKNPVLLQGKNAGVNRWPKRNRSEK